MAVENIVALKRKAVKLGADKAQVTKMDREDLEDLISKLGKPKKSAVKKKGGSVVKKKSKTTASASVKKRGPGRPKKEEAPIKRGRGRPPGSKNKPSATETPTKKRGPGRPRKEETPVKRGPGRPRKTEAEPVAKKRGRPAKTTAVKRGRPVGSGNGTRAIIGKLDYSNEALADWNPREGGLIHEITRLLKKYKDNVDKVYDALLDDINEWIPKEKRNGEKRTKSERETYLRFRISHVRWLIGLATGQHKSGSGNGKTTKAVAKKAATSVSKARRGPGRPKGSTNKATKKKTTARR